VAVCSKVQLIIGQVTITTAVPAARVAITWRGTILGSDLAGEYVVRCDNPKVKEASRHQVGVWSCKLVRPLSAPNPDEAGAAWVYNDGTEEGPLTAETFDQRLKAGEWPQNAIVGLDDRTTWSTVLACLEKIIALAAARN
jgi:hypothetical protein